MCIETFFFVYMELSCGPGLVYF